MGKDVFGGKLKLVMKSDVLLLVVMNRFERVN